MSTALDVHEKIEADRPPEPLQDRTFGLVFSWLFVIIGLFPFMLGRAVRWWALVPGGVFLILALTAPHSLHWVNIHWTKFGIILGRVGTFITTALMFYTVFFPVALLLRILGKDLLALHREPAASTYWSMRDHTQTTPESMHDQF